MTSHPDSQPDWGSPYRLIAREKWKAQSAAMGQPVADALVEYAQPQPGMKVLDPASGLQPGGDPFKSAVPGGLSEILRSAGFNSIDEEAKTLPRTWPVGVEEVWQQAQSAAVPLRPMLKRVPPEKWAEIHAEVHTAIRQYSDGEKIAFAVSVVLAWGRK
jgi:hypothetical protein